MCLGQWSLYGFIHDSNVQDVARLPELPESEYCDDGDFLMPNGWDKI